MDITFNNNINTCDEMSYDEYHNENLLHLHRKPKIGKSVILKKIESKYEEKKCKYNSYDIFPYGGLFYHDLIIKDVLKFYFKKEQKEENVKNKDYIYLGAGIMKEQQNKKNEDKNKMVFIFFINETLLENLQKESQSKTSKNLKKKRKKKKDTYLNNENVLSNDNSNDYESNINNENYKSKQESTDFSVKNKDKISLITNDKEKVNKKKRKRLKDIDDILNEKKKNKNVFIRTKTSLFYEEIKNKEGGTCTDVNRNVKQINFETFYRDWQNNDENNTNKINDIINSEINNDKSTTIDSTYEKSKYDKNESDDDEISYYDNNEDNDEDEDEDYDEDGNEKKKKKNVYIDKDNIFLLNILHHQNNVYSVKWKESSYEGFSILVSLCFDGYMYIWKEHMNCQNKFTYISICRIYILFFENIINNIKWCWVNKNEQNENYNFFLNNKNINISKNEYLIVYGSRNEIQENKESDNFLYKRNKIKNCIYFDEFNDNYDSKEYMVFSMYAIFNIYDNNIHIKNILNYENVPINVNFDYIIEAKFEYDIMNTSLISIYTDDTYFPESEYNIKYGKWKVKKIHEHSNSLFSNKNYFYNRFFNINETYFSNSSLDSSPNDSHISYSNEKKEKEKKKKENDFLLFQKLLNAISNLMPPFSIKISTFNFDFYKILIKPSDIWIKKKKSISVRYLLDYKNYDLSKKYKKKFSFKKKKYEEHYSIDFNIYQNVFILVNKLNNKMYLYNFYNSLKKKKSHILKNSGEYSINNEISNIVSNSNNINTNYDVNINNYEKTYSPNEENFRENQKSFKEQKHQFRVYSNQNNDLNGYNKNNSYDFDASTTEKINDFKNNSNKEEMHYSKLGKYDDENIDRFKYQNGDSHNLLPNKNDYSKTRINNNKMKKKKNQFSLICCINSMYIDNHYILKHKEINFLNKKTHFIYSYVYKICNYYEQIKKNKNIFISTNELIEKKSIIPLVYKSHMIESFDSFFLLMCIDKNRETIFVLKSEKMSIVHNMKMLCIFDEDCNISDTKEKKKLETKTNNQKITLDNNKYIDKVKSDLTQIEGNQFKIIDYMIKDFHLCYKNNEQNFLLIIKYIYLDKEKKKKSVYLLVLSTLEIYNQTFIYINLKLKNMFTFFNPLKSEFLFSYFYLSFQDTFLFATNHFLKTSNYKNTADYELNNQKNTCNYANNVNENYLNNENNVHNNNSNNYENNENIFSFKKKEINITENNNLDKEYILVLNDNDYNNDDKTDLKNNIEIDENQNNYLDIYCNNRKDVDNMHLNNNNWKKDFVNLYFFCANKGSATRFLQIKNIYELVNIILYDNYILLITNNNLHILNLNIIHNNLLYKEVSYIDSSNVQKKKIYLISLFFPNMLRNKKNELLVRCTKKKNTYFIVLSFLINNKKIYSNNFNNKQKEKKKKNENYYASIILFNTNHNEEKWNILKYGNSIFFFSKHIFLFENTLLLLKKLNKNKIECNIKEETIVKDYYNNNQISFHKINLYKKFKKYKQEYEEKKQKNMVFYHPIILLNYIKIGLFSHVNLALRLLLNILLYKFFKKKKKYVIKKNCSLNILLEKEKSENYNFYNYNEISYIHENQFLFDLNFINTEIYNLFKNKRIPFNENKISKTDKSYSEKEENKENKDKSIYLFENESVSLDDFNLNSESDESEEKKEKEKKKDKNSLPSENTNIESNDENYSKDEDEDDCKKEIKEEKFKEFLKYSRVINFELNVDEIKMLQILTLHVNIPYLNDFYQLVLFCILNSFYNNFENDKNIESDHASQKENYTNCHCEYFNLDLGKEITKNENIYICEYLSNSNENILNKNNLTCILIFFFRFYINCFFLLNIKLDIHYQYTYFFYFMNDTIASNIYNYLEKIITYYNYYFHFQINEKDLLSINLFDNSLNNKNTDENNISTQKKENYYTHLVKKKKLLFEEKNNKKEKFIELNNIQINRLYNSEFLLEGILNYNFFNFFKNCKLFYFLSNKEDILFVYDILINRTIKKINSLNIDDKEKQNEINECLDFLALLYIAKNEKQKLMLFYKIKKQHKIFDFLTNDFKTERWIRALINNAYKLMQIKRYYLAVAFFILSRDIKDAVDVIHQYLDDTQLSIFIIRLIYISYGVGDEENNKISNFIEISNKFNIINSSSFSDKEGSPISDMNNCINNENEKNDNTLPNVIVEDMNNNKEVINENIKEKNTYDEVNNNFLFKYLNYIFNDKINVNNNIFLSIIKYILLKNYEEAYSICENEELKCFFFLILKNTIKDKMINELNKNDNVTKYNILENNVNFNNYGMMNKFESYFCSFYYFNKKIYNLFFIFYFIFFHNIKFNKLIELYEKYKCFFILAFEMYLEKFLFYNKYLFYLISSHSFANKKNIKTKNNPYILPKDSNKKENNSINSIYSLNLFSNIINILFFLINDNDDSKINDFLEKNFINRNEEEIKLENIIFNYNKKTSFSNSCNGNKDTFYHNDETLCYNNNLNINLDKYNMISLINKLKDLKIIECFGKQLNLSNFLISLLSKIDFLDNQKHKLISKNSITFEIIYDIINENEFKMLTPFNSYYISLNKYNRILTHLFFNFFSLYIIEEKKNNVMLFLINYIISILFIYINDVVHILFNFLRNKKNKSLTLLHIPLIQIIFLRISLSNYFIYEKNTKTNKYNKKKNEKKREEEKEKINCENENEFENYINKKIKHHNLMEEYSDIYKMHIKINYKYFCYYIHLIDLFLCYLCVFILCFIILKKYYNFFIYNDVYINSTNTMRNNSKKNNKKKSLKKLFYILYIFLKKIKKLNWNVENIYKKNNTIVNLFNKFIKCCYINKTFKMDEMKKNKKNECNKVYTNQEHNRSYKNNIASDEEDIKRLNELKQVENIPKNNNANPQINIKSCEYLKKKKMSSSDFLFEKYCIINIFLSIFELVINNFQIFAYKSNIFFPKLNINNTYKREKEYVGESHTQLYLKEIYKKEYKKKSNNINKNTYIFYYKTYVLLLCIDNLSIYISKFIFSKLKILLYNSAYSVKNTLLTFLSFPFFFNKMIKKKNNFVCEHFIDSHISYFYNKHLYLIWKLNNCTYRSFLLFFNKNFYNYNDYMNDHIDSNNRLDNYITNNVSNFEKENKMEEEKISQYNGENEIKQQASKEKNNSIEKIKSENKMNSNNDNNNITNFKYNHKNEYKKYYDLYNSGCRIYENEYILIPNTNIEKNNIACNHSNFIFRSSKSHEKFTSFTSKINFLKKFKKNMNEKNKNEDKNDYSTINYSRNNIKNLKKKKNSNLYENSYNTCNEKCYNSYYSLSYNNLFNNKEKLGEDFILDEKNITNKYDLNTNLMKYKNTIQNTNENNNNNHSLLLNNIEHMKENSNNNKKNNSYSYINNENINEINKNDIQTLCKITRNNKNSNKNNKKLPYVIPLSLLFYDFNERHSIQKEKIDNSNNTILYIHRKDKIKKICILEHLKKLNKKCKFINYISYNLKCEYIDINNEEQFEKKKKNYLNKNKDYKNISNNMNDKYNNGDNISLLQKNKLYYEEEKKFEINDNNNMSNDLSYNIEFNKAIIDNDSSSICLEKENRIIRKKENNKNQKILLDINMNKLVYIYKCMHIQCMHNLTPLCSFLSNFIPNDFSITNFFNNKYNNYFVNNIFFHNFFYTYDNTLTLLLNSNDMNSLYYDNNNNNNNLKSIYSDLNYSEKKKNKNTILHNNNIYYKNKEKGNIINERKHILNFRIRNVKNDSNCNNNKKIREDNKKNILENDNKQKKKGNLKFYDKYNKPNEELKNTLIISKSAEKYIELILLLLYNNISLNDKDKINVKDEKSEFKYLFDYLDKNVNKCIRKKYTFINRLANNKNNFSFLKTGAIISHPFLPFFALIHINNGKNINNEVDKTKFQIRLCKFTNNHDDISYKYGYITSVMWNNEGNLLMISDNCGYLYIYNIFLGNFISNKIKNNSNNVNSNMNSLFSTDIKNKEIMKKNVYYDKVKYKKEKEGKEDKEDNEENEYDKEEDDNGYNEESEDEYENDELSEGESEESEESEESKKSEESNKCKIKEKNKIRNFFKDNFLKNKRKYIEEKKTKKKKKDNKKSYIIKEALCVIKLHDEIIDIKSLNDNNFYLVSIGKGINRKSISNHTTFINSDYLENKEDFNKTKLSTKNSILYNENQNSSTLVEEKKMNHLEFRNSTLFSNKTELEYQKNQDETSKNIIKDSLEFQKNSDHNSIKKPNEKCEKNNSNSKDIKTNSKNIDTFLNLHVFKTKKSYFKSKFFYFDPSNINFFRKNKKQQSATSDNICICIWDICSILTNEEKKYLKNKYYIVSKGYKNDNKKVKNLVLHPTLVCIISNLSTNKIYLNKNKNFENNNFITSFCTWSSNQLYKHVSPFEDTEKKKLKKNTNNISEVTKRKNNFWNFFKNKIYSNNFSQDAYIFYGDQFGYVHIVHLQIYKEILCFKAFDLPIFKIFICKNLCNKLLILAEGKLRIYKIKSILEISFIKEIEIIHDITPKKCICEEKINELKEKKKKEENENDEGISIFNLSYFLSSNYNKKQSNTRSEDKINPSINDSYNKITFEDNKNLFNDSPNNLNVINFKNNLATSHKNYKKKEKGENSSSKDNVFKKEDSNSSFNSLTQLKTLSDSEEIDINSDRDNYQSVIIGGINFGYLGFNFSKFMNNKKKTTIIDAYLLSNSHLVTISNNGTIVLTKV
ncbi:conserved Plasmodium membrane protein, unknown function [Plasmodium relictum]|uniref:RAVE complex protein Rav1 C-terminal domain-containing protein n=1 Tax=Plasmodium relictum TaxID=85471 RepID=A0A1J1H1P2_PLARL|nr:conserved Plasmodium membrane protein, unknown function [Plasmodium relictum]CRG98486.1 conserved Plasmodium membrane protein, unknown function [Plasmodium relictum]